MIRAVVDIELARQQWDDGRRRIERSRSDSVSYHRLSSQVEIVTAELTRRIGQTFTLEELAEAYDAADRWAFEALHDAMPDDAPAETSTVADAAFHSYSRRASDYAP